MKIREYLKENRLITDGAMGTYYEDKFGEENAISEKMNTKSPEKIKSIHMDYLHAGAKLLRTNTFASNSMFFNSRAEILENVKAGYCIAQEAVEEYKKQHLKDDVFIAADLGTIYDSDHMDYENVLEEYKQICDTFLLCGAECFIFETQSDFIYLEPITSYIKGKSDAFIIAQFSFDKSGYTRSGISIEKMVRTAAEMDTIDTYGLNCGVEAAHMYELLKKVTFPNDKYISALPNAGYPYALRGKTIYSNNVAYYVKKMQEIANLGMDMIGGCCGTTPAHIHALYKSMEGVKKSKKKVGLLQKKNISMLECGFVCKLNRKEKAFIVELDPPFQTDIEKVLTGARELAEADVDLITLSDSPLARTRMDAGQLAVKIQHETGIQVMPHVSCRDKNIIAMRASMLGTYMNGIRHYLIVTGDPVARGDRDIITSVFDFNSIKFMQYVNEMNQDVFEGEPVVYGGALNYHGANPDAIIQRIQLKADAGCACVLTQPVYSTEDVERLRYIKSGIDIKLMCGIMPLVSYKNAMFMSNEMPGVHISPETVARYTPEMTREEAEKVASEISVEIAEKLYDIADGFYFMTPFNRTGLIVQIIQSIRNNHQGE